MSFIGVDFTVTLVDLHTFSTGACGHSSNLGSLHDADIVVYSSDAVVVGVTNVNFHVPPLLVVERRDTAWLIEARLKRCLVLQSILPAAQPRKYFIPEWVHHFDLVIVSVSDNDDILLGDEVNTKGVL